MQHSIPGVVSGGGAAMAVCPYGGSDGPPDGRAGAPRRRGQDKAAAAEGASDEWSGEDEDDVLTGPNQSKQTNQALAPGSTSLQPSQQQPYRHRRTDTHVLDHHAEATSSLYYLEVACSNRHAYFAVRSVASKIIWSIVNSS